MRFLKLTLIFAFLTAFSVGASAQNTVEGVAKEVCKEVCKLDLNDTSVPAIARMTALIKGLAPRIEHGKVIENYKKQHPDAAKLPQQELEDRIITDIACILLRDCKNFAALAVNNGRLLAEPSKETIAYGDRLNTLLKEKSKTTPMSLSVINECMTKVIEENKSALTAKYGENYIAAFQNDLKPYLFTRCEPYQRWSIGNMIKQFRMLQSLGL